MGHPPKAMKYITCRVMSFRPWQASCSPLRGLACLHSSISVILSIPCLSPSASLITSVSFKRLYISSLLFFYSFVYIFVLSSLFFLPLLSQSLSEQTSEPCAWSSSATSVPQSATTHCSAVIQKPHINTGISPRDYLSVACLLGRVLLCNLYSPMNRVGLGKRGFGGVWRLIGF